MKVAFFEYEPWMESYVQDYLVGHEVVFDVEPLTEDNAAKYADAEAVSVFVFSKVTDKVVGAMPALKMIAARSTGFDHIDLKAATSRGIPVTNVPHYGSVTVAEHTWALILTLSRNIYKGYEMTEDGRFDITDMRGFDLENKTLGLIGLGEIGKKVAEMSLGFNMKLRIFNRTRDEAFAARFPNCVFVETAEDVYSHADIISFHLPLTPQTQHILNIDNYQRLKPGCIVVNTSRGAVIETQALIKGLNEGIISSAGLDVLEGEAALKGQSEFNVEKMPSAQELSEAYLDHVLIQRDDVVITPHNAFNSDESIKRLVNSNLDNILAFHNGAMERLDRVN